MANLPENDNFNTNVTQIDSGENITGGTTGVLNRALIELTNRTRYLFNNSINLRKSNLSAGSNHIIDCSDKNKWVYIPITGNTTINMINVSEGCIIYIEMDDAGSYTITWQSEGATGNVIWDGGSEPNWAGSGHRSVVSFVSPNGTILYGKIIYSDLNI